MFIKKVSDIRMVMQRVSFSPESGGVWKPKITCGGTRNKKKYTILVSFFFNPTKKLDKVMELVGGGSVINGAYPV